MTTPPYPPPPEPPGYGPPTYGPPGYYPPPGYGPPAPPPQRPSRTLRNVLIIVGVVVVLCCGGAIAGGAYLVNRALDAGKPAMEAAGAFTSDLESGDDSAAYGMLCASTRASFTMAEFRRVVQTRPHIVGHRISLATVRTTNGRSTATVSARLTQNDGAVVSHVFTLVKENGAWKVCGQPY